MVRDTSVKHLLEQWKTIVVCLAGLAGMVLFLSLIHILHFGNGEYLVSVRKLPNETVKGLEGKDYEVLDIDMINMYRTELSGLVRGNFKISRLVPDGKDVKQVYYVDKEGKLCLLYTSRCV